LMLIIRKIVVVKKNCTLDLSSYIPKFGDLNSNCWGDKAVAYI